MQSLAVNSSVRNARVVSLAVTCLRGGVARPAMAYSTSTRRFEGRVAVVTGAGRDIGAATARRLGMEGASVVLHYHSSEGGAQEAADDIRAAGSQAVAVHADLSCADGAAAVMASAAELGPEVHAVVHNSGGLIERRKLPEMDAEFLRHVMDVNFTSLFFLMQAAYPVLAEGGAVVTLSSQAARDGGGPGAGAYAASKGAVHTYTRSLAKELWAKRVRVNAVSPGMSEPQPARGGGVEPADTAWLGCL